MIIETMSIPGRAPTLPDALQERAALEEALDALIHYGTAETLARIRRLAKHPSPSVAERARFAETLVGHRLGADWGVELPELALDPVPTRFRIPLQIRPAGSEDRQQFWNALAQGTWGVAPALQYAVRLDFDEEAWLIVPDARYCYGERLERLHTTRSLLGIVAERSLPLGFSPAFLILTSPGPEGKSALVHVHDPDGAVVYGGRLHVEDGVAHFTIGCLRDRTDTEGAAPLEIEGRLSEDGLHVSAAWSAVVTMLPGMLQIVNADPPRRG